MSSSTLVARFSSPLAAALIAEWRRLSSCPGSSARVLAWGLDEELGGSIEIAGDTTLDDVLVRIGFLAGRCDDEADRALGAVVRRAATDELAARVVLQRVLPGLVAVARRRGRRAGSSQQAFDEVVASAWIVIRRFPLDRRPRKIAANLVRDAEYEAFVRSRRLRSATERPGLTAEAELGSTAVFDDEPADAAAEVAELLLAAHRHGVDEDDLDFVRAWARGLDTAALAARYAVCERTVRNRRRRIAHQLRAVAAA